ncbi:MAG: shikimate dehydrogenase [Candidatus Melainabacteria bacterium]|nr:shikimate dehydrogenase [Candidatus Melainabacteria bacterium]
MSTQKHSFYLLGLIGHPVKHSLSPVMFKAALNHLGLKGEYHLIDLLPHELAPGLSKLVAQGFTGFNVTIPHKRAVFALCNELTLESQQAHAVNAVLVKDKGCLVGHNTDVAGFKKALLANMPANGKLETCCVIGAGGAAHAAVTALIELKCARIIIAVRKPASALDLVEKMQASRWADDIRVPQFEVVVPELNELPCTPNLVVNCTPIGLNGQVAPQWVLDLLKLMGSDGLLFDMVYCQDGTLPELASVAKRQGLNVCDGMDMLIAQAQLSFQFMTGVAIPEAVMAQAILACRKGQLAYDKKGST